ncbi:MAG: TetR/AcrR family transcriptional regulator [Bacillota bacterium]|nr:TetR/AcrR family transcriptional regulator [Bacillota bacterium]
MPKIVDTEEKKLEIATKAIPVFSEKGYYNTNLKDISKACNMGRTTLYQYFNNKDEIYFYILELGMSFFKMNYDAIKDDDSLSSIEKIERLVEYLIINLNGQTVSKAFIDFWLMVRHNNKALESELKSLYKELESTFTNLINESIKKGEIKEVHGPTLSTLILGMLQSFSVKDMINETVDSKSACQTIMILINGVKKEVL